MTPNEQANLDSRLIDAADCGDAKAVQTLLASGANVHASDDWALCCAAVAGHTEVVKVLLSSGAHVYARDDYALRWAAYWGRPEPVQLLSKHLFAPESWRGKSRAEIEAYASALYNKIEAENPQTDHLRMASDVLIDSVINCWHQVRPAPPKIQISPLPAAEAIVRS